MYKLILIIDNRELGNSVKYFIKNYVKKNYTNNLSKYNKEKLTRICILYTSFWIWIYDVFYCFFVKKLLLGKNELRYHVKISYYHIL